jgi:hypothetical protein
LEETEDMQEEIYPYKTTISPGETGAHHFYQELEDQVSYRMSENETILLKTKHTG